MRSNSMRITTLDSGSRKHLIVMSAYQEWAFHFAYGI
jgi:hypothetical protein